MKYVILHLMVNGQQSDPDHAPTTMLVEQPIWQQCLAGSHENVNLDYKLFDDFAKSENPANLELLRLL